MSEVWLKEQIELTENAIAWHEDRGISCQYLKDELKEFKRILNK